MKKILALTLSVVTAVTSADVSYVMAAQNNVCADRIDSFDDSITCVADEAAEEGIQSKDGTDDADSGEDTGTDAIQDSPGVSEGNPGEDSDSGDKENSGGNTEVAGDSVEPGNEAAGDSGEPGNEEADDAGEPGNEDADDDKQSGSAADDAAVSGDLVSDDACIEETAPNAGMEEEQIGKVEAQAEEIRITAEGKVNDIVYKCYSDGSMTIEGTGDYVSATSIDPPWMIYYDNVYSATVNITGITSTRNMFYGFKRMKTVDISGLDTSEVTNMSGMFYGCKSLKEIDLSHFDTSKVTDMSMMFAGGNELRFIEGSAHMPTELHKLDLSAFDTRNVTDMSGMFQYNGGLQELNLNGFNTGNVTDMSHMFEACIELNLSDENIKCLDTSSVRDMSSMFKYYRLEKYSNFVGSSRPDPQLDLSAFDTAQVQDMSYMFYDNPYLETLTIQGFRTENVTDMAHMFDGCRQANIEGVGSLNTQNVTDMSCMFSGCQKMSSYPTASAFLDVNGFDMSKVTNMNGMFSGCTGIRSIGITGIDLSGFDTRNVTDMNSMFSGCTRLTSVDLSGFDTQNVTDMSNLFAQCNQLASVLFGVFDTHNVTNMSGMFENCAALESVDVSAFDTHNVTDMCRMFSGCIALTSVDAGSFDTHNVTQMSEMFKDCTALESVDVSGFDTHNVTDMYRMFSGCSALKSLDLSSLNMSSYKSSNAVDGVPFIDGCNSLLHICTPINVDGQVELPEGKWYDKNGVMYTRFPINMSYSISLYRDSYPADSEENREVLFISGISVQDKIYDAEPYTYGEAAVIEDRLGNEITGIGITPWYSGKLADGSEYARSKEAPAQAGSYDLDFEISGLDESRYIIKKTTYHFVIRPRSVTISAPSIKIELGGMIPELSGLTCEVNGLLEGHTLSSQPQLKFAQPAETIPTDKAGVYDIIPYGAELDAAYAYNYSMEYIRGKLGVGMDYDDDKVIAAGQKREIVWKLYHSGKLTIEGTGNYNQVSDSDWSVGGDTDPLKSQAAPPWIAAGLRDKIINVKVNVTGMTCMTYMFYGCKNLKSIDLSGLDTSKVTNMNRVFDGCSSLESLDLSGFDTGSAITMYGMFKDCKNLRTLDVSSFDTSKVQLMGYLMYGMFEGCEKLTELDLSNFNTSNVEDMGRMFEGCKKLTGLDLSNFNTSNVEDMSCMFMDCRNLKKLNVSSFDTSSADLRAMFSDCRSLESLDLSNFSFNTVTHSMFSGCSSLKNLTLGTFGVFPVGTDLGSMFSGCSSLKSLDLSGLDTSGVEKMYYMFADCTSLETLKLGSSFTNEMLDDMRGMFRNCRSLKSLDLSSFNAYQWGTYVGPTGFETHRNNPCMTDMFAGCSSLVWLDLGGMNMESAPEVSMSGMFQGCTSLVNLNLKGFSVRNAVDMSCMFADCSALVGLDLSGFDLSALKNEDSGSRIFDGALSLSYILTPKNCRTDIALPICHDGDKWTGEDGTEYTMLPKDLTQSITLGKNGYLENETGKTKQIVFVSGIEVKNKTYDKKAVSYADNAVITDSEGNIVEGLSPEFVYEGNLADGTDYTAVQQAPAQAGTYIMTVKVNEAERENYIIHQDTYLFVILPREIVISAESVKIEEGAAVPTLSELTYKVNGLLEEDELPEGEEPFTELKLKYNVPIQNIDTSKSGKYYIIPGGASLNAALANNYEIRYERGTLYIGDAVNDNPDDDINKIDLSSQELQATIANIKPKTYDRYPYEPALKVRVTENRKKKTLTEGMDYTVEYENNINAGTGTAIVKGCGDYKGELRKTFIIKPKPVTKLKYIIGSMSVGDSGAEPPVYVYDGARLLEKGSDYTLSGTETLGMQASKGVTVTVNGAADAMAAASSPANYTGSKKIKIPVYDGDAAKIIKPGDIYWEADNISAEASLLSMDYWTPYTGKAVKPEVTIRTGGVLLTKNKDYKIAYQNNKNAGTAYIIVTGKGEYKGKVATTFEITPLNIADAAQNLEIKPISDKTYNGKLQKPAVKVKVGGRTLRRNKDYTLSYINNLHAGGEAHKATVIITGRGNYSGSAQQSFTIKPQSIRKISLKGTYEGTGDKKLTVMYSKRKLKEGYDYTIEVGEINKNKITITFKAKDGGDFTGSVVKKVKIR